VVPSQCHSTFPVSGERLDFFEQQYDIGSLYLLLRPKS